MKSFIRVLIAVFLLAVCAQAHAGLWDSGGESASTTQTQGTVTITDTAQIVVPAWPSGQDVFIQNNDPVGILYINLSGTATVSGSLLVLEPGIAIAINIPNTTNAVSIIGSIASNPNVAILVGR